MNPQAFLLLIPTLFLWANGNHMNETKVIRGEPVSRLGAIIINEGTTQFIAGTMLVTIDLRLEGYIENQLVETYISFLDLLHIIEKGGLTFSHLQINNLEGNIKSVSHTVRDLLDHVPDKFIKEKLGFDDLDDLEQFWRTKVFNALRGVTIGTIDNKVVPNIPEREKKVVHPKLRGKRGLINVGGDILHAVFGVSTSKEIHDLEEKEEIRIQQILEATRVIEVKTSKAEEKVADALQHLKKATEGLLTIQNRENRLEVFVMISETISHIEVMLLHLLNLAREVKTRITLLQRGIVPAVINHIELKEIIEQGVKKFHNLKFPLNTEYLSKANLTSFLNLCHSEGTSEPFIFVIFVPFVEKDESYDLFKLIKFPLKLGEDVTMIGENIQPYIAISNFERVELDEIKTCERLENKNEFLCSLKTPKLSERVETCAYAVVKNDSEIAMRTCDYEKTKFDAGFHAIYTEDRWFVHLVKDTIANLQCESVSRNKIKKVDTFSGNVIVNPPCIFSSRNFSLPTIKTVVSRFKQEPIQLLPELILDTKNLSIFNGDKRELLEEVDRDIGTLRELAKNHSKVLDVLNVNSFGFGNSRDVHGAITSVMVGILVLTVGIWFICYKWFPSFLSCCCPIARPLAQDTNTPAFSEELRKLKLAVDELREKQQPARGPPPATLPTPPPGAGPPVTSTTRTPHGGSKDIEGPPVKLTTLSFIKRLRPTYLDLTPPTEDAAKYEIPIRMPTEENLDHVSVDSGSDMEMGKSVKFNRAIGSRPKTPPKRYKRLESLRLKPRRDKEADIVEMKLLESPPAESMKNESSDAPSDNAEMEKTATSAKMTPSEAIRFIKKMERIKSAPVYEHSA